MSGQLIDIKTLFDIPYPPHISQTYFAASWYHKTRYGEKVKYRKRLVDYIRKGFPFD